MAMADTIMVLAICEKLGRFATLATISQTTNFMRAAVRRDVIGFAKVVKTGRSTIFGQVEMSVDGSNESIAQTISSYALLPDGAGAFNRADER